MSYRKIEDKKTAAPNGNGRLQFCGRPGQSRRFDGPCQTRDL